METYMRKLVILLVVLIAFFSYIRDYPEAGTVGHAGMTGGELLRSESPSVVRP
jgi:hypothetical protein